MRMRDCKGMMRLKYITSKEAAEKWRISHRRIHSLCSQGRIKDAERHGGVWLIPETATNRRMQGKSGSYIKRGQALKF